MLDDIKRKYSYVDKHLLQENYIELFIGLFLVVLISINIHNFLSSRQHEKLVLEYLSQTYSYSPVKLKKGIYVQKTHELHGKYLIDTFISTDITTDSIRLKYQLNLKKSGSFIVNGIFMNQEFYMVGSWYQSQDILFLKPLDGSGGALPIFGGVRLVNQEKDFLEVQVGEKLVKMHVLNQNNSSFNAQSDKDIFTSLHQYAFNVVFLILLLCFLVKYRSSFKEFYSRNLTGG